MCKRMHAYVIVFVLINDSRSVCKSQLLETIGFSDYDGSAWKEDLCHVASILKECSSVGDENCLPCDLLVDLLVITYSSHDIPLPASAQKRSQDKKC